jgi:hypothetical protein
LPEAVKRRIAASIIVLCGALAGAFFASARVAWAGDAVTPSPHGTPSAIEQESADVDPTSPTEAWTFIGAYTGATYGPGDLRLLQIIPREEILRIGSSLLRATLPPIRTIQGVDSGFGDAQLFYLFAHHIPQGRLGIGFDISAPTASSTLLGSGKWSIGPSVGFAKMNRKARFIGGALLQTFFSVAGPSWRHAQSLVAFQPIAVAQLGNGWSLRSADSTWTFDMERGSSIMPLSLGVGKLTHIGKQTFNFILSDEATVVHANAPNAPKNTLRFYIRIIYPRDYERSL